MDHRINGKENNKRAKRKRIPNELGSPEKIQAGDAGTFLLQHPKPLLDDEKIVGTLPTEHNNLEVYRNLSIVSEFLKQHALAVLAGSSTNGKSTQDVAAIHTSNTKPVKATSFYLPTVRDFEELQLEHQAAGLCKNSTVDTEIEFSQIVNGHASALKIAIVKANDRENGHENGSPTHDSSGLSKNLLCYLHSILCQSHAQKGNFRTTEAQADNTLFCSVNKIDAEMENLLTAQNLLWSTWWVKKSRRNDDLARQRETYDAVSIAAIMMYAINDIHPFADGNGRMSRICANYVLRLVIGLPFSVTMIETPIQRQEYAEGIKQARISIQQLLSGNNESMTEPSLGVKENESVLAGAFEPIIHMILDRISLAIQKLQQLLEERGCAAIAGEEARIARIVRERAATGRCIICLSEGPNIATLCCGQAVHLNCIAEWLVNHTTCMSCRAPMPQLVCTQALSRVEDGEDNNSTNFLDYSEEGMSGYSEDDILSSRDSSTDTSTDSDQDILWQPESENEYTSSSEDDSAPSEAYSYSTSDESRDSAIDDATAVEVSGEEPLSCRSCRNRAAVNCDNHMCRRCCRQINCSGCDHHTLISETTTTEYPEESALTLSIAEGTMVTEAEEAPLYCQSCSNLAALDCENQMCGRCCRHNDSDDFCSRHGVVPGCDVHEESLYDEYSRRISPEAPLERIIEHTAEDSIEDIIEDTTEHSVETSIETSSSDTSEDRTVTEQTRCSQCNNLAAANCDNLMCGKCCTSHFCNRHNQ